ncbi:YihY/virulence factor BrkB family protein [Ancylobacter sp. MQZ15Z-1]|uniref:YihY/virulence factor BrkB family protein n=1 Tax=Ancylobacter mangrovi TaxID=2972472 RepID=A0A9X2PF72_9HYPH|nr:YihY/virulence factor BrkB family protein [Ancylobacter mangrovi]MCS0495078.1 YihY/virulence factor BrkB family protein [Ancylobacter mangrovi]
MTARSRTDGLVVAGALATITLAALLQLRIDRSAPVNGRVPGASPPVPSPVPAGVPVADDGASAFAGAGRGRLATAPDEITPSGWRDIALRIYANISEHRVLAIGAGVTFYSILALFPAVAAFVSLFGLFAQPSEVIAEMDQWRGILPDGAIEVVGGQVQRIASSGDASLGLAFFFSLALAIWSANAGMKALFDALNIVYAEREKRSFLVLNAVSLVFTVGAIVIMLAAMGAVVVLPIVLAYVPMGGGELLVRLGRWPAMFVVLAFALALLYRYGPSRANARWRWLSVGSIAAAFFWMAASMGFSWYATNFASYNETYGSLGAIIGFMVWIWISTVVILIGAELNAETEHQTARDTTTGTPMPLGLRGATMADTLGPTPP